MQTFEMSQLRESAGASNKRYFEFLRVPAMSLGIYNLPAKSEDLQQPHKQDEIYFVQKGRAAIEVDGIKQPVSPGNIIFVPAEADHRFLEIEEDLELLVFFAPAEEN